MEEGSLSLSIRLPETHPEGRVILNDTWYPGWEAELDGMPARILQHQQAFRALEVGAQSREIRMRYKPLSLRLGFLLSLAAWTCILALMLKERGAKLKS
jgi:uncharacterized membrane protein YfhO